MRWLIVFIFIAQLKGAEIEDLFKGNQKFLQNLSLQKKRQEWVTDQNPSFCVLACSDSRVAPEIICSQTLGSMFVIRNAGNVVDEIALASIEFAVEVLQVENLIVLGHQNCGAVRGALEVTLENIEVKPTRLHSIYKKIQPSFSNIVDFESINQSILDQAAQDNAIYQLKVLLKKSPIIRGAYRENRLSLFSLYYEMDTGKIFKLNGI